MLVKEPPVAAPSRKQLHARKCFLLGITSAEKVERLWQEEQRKRERNGSTSIRGRRR